MEADDYLTIAGPSTGDYRERGSKFLAYAFPIRHEDDVKKHLEWSKKEHPKSRHHCFAYRIGMDGNRFRANDDGEPSGSAGRPILGQIDSYELTNVLVIVVRYFGGTKLGVPGLINAYKTSTAEAIDTAEIITKTVETTFDIEFGYEHMSPIMNALKRWDVNITKQDFNDSALIQISIPKSQVDETLLKLKASILKISLEEAETRTLENITINMTE